MSLSNKVNGWVSRMKLAILTQYYPPEVGAPQARLSEIAAHFAKKGHKVTVLTAMPNYPSGKIHPGYGGALRRDEQNGVKVIRTFVYPTQRAAFLPRLTNYFSFVLSSSIAGSLLLEQPDYLLVESPPLFLGLAGVLLSRLKRARLIFNVSDLWPESAIRMGILKEGGWPSQLSTRLERFCYQHAWLITGQSKSIIANIAERFPACPTFHLSNGVDVDRFGQGQYSEAVRNTIATNGDFVALYAGLHGLAQGLDQILAASVALSREQGFKFVLVGDGPMKATLLEQSKQKCLSNVAFLEPRPAKDIPPLLAAADALLITLKVHIPGAVPSKLYEAMASGRPIVLMAEGEAAELVRNHEAGIVVAPGDVSGMATALRQLRADPDLRRALGENGRRAAVKHFDRSKIVSAFIEHLEVYP